VKNVTGTKLKPKSVKMLQVSMFVIQCSMFITFLSVILL